MPFFSFLAGRRSGALLAGAACGAFAVGAGAQAITPIHSIMRNLPNSPYLGQTVTVTGVVVGQMPLGAFYITALDSDRDADSTTAEGIQIYASTALNAACGVTGNTVTITGTVQNGTAVNGANTPGTGISPTACNATPNGAVSTTSTLTQATAYGQDLPFTGMPIANTSFYAISPTGGNADAAGFVTSNGQFWVTINKPTNGHAFKTAGLAADNFYPPPPAPAKGSSPGIPTWDGNPERLFVDTTTFGGAPVDIGAGQILTCAPAAGLTTGATKGIGVIDYSLGYNRLLIFKSTTCTVSGSIAPEITSPSDSKHFHVGTINLLGFKNSGSAGYATRLSKAAMAIVNTFGKPEILAVQEVEDKQTLQEIGNAANALAGGTTTYQAYWDPSQDSNRMGLGFLVNTKLVAVSSTERVNPTHTFTLLNGTTVPLWENPPFVLEAGVIRAGANYQVEVVNIDTTGREGIDDPVNGPNVWMRRGQQAHELSEFASSEQGLGKNLLIAGEYNAYSFSDGFADIVGVVGNLNPPAQGTVAQYEPSVTNPPMYNFVKSITVANSTYNVIEQGNARSIEHILCSTSNTASPNSASDAIYTYIDFVTQPHWTTDFPAVNANNPAIAAGLTSRDGFVGAFLIPPVPTTAATDVQTIGFGNVYVGATRQQPATFTNTTTFASTVVVNSIQITGPNAGDFGFHSTCTTLASHAYCSLLIDFTPTASGTRTATLTVNSDSGLNPAVTIQLSGTGLDPAATLTPTAFTYPSTAVGSTTTAQTFTWKNISATPITVVSVAKTGDFNITANGCAGAVAAGASCTVQVAFAPSALGTRTGSLVITSTAVGSPILTATLSGFGLPNITITPALIDFGSIDVGFPRTGPPVTITNNSTHGIALSGFGATGDFSWASTTCGSTIAAGAQCTGSITFKPTATGPRTGVFSVTTNDVPSLLSVQLQGSGADFNVTVAPSSGDVIAGKALDFGATFTAVGGFAGTINATCVVPGSAGDSTCSVSPASFSLSSTAKSNVHVTTVAQYTVIGYGGAGNAWTLIAAGLGGLIVFKLRRKKDWRGAALVALALMAGGFSAGCAGKTPGQNANPTLPGKYTYTVTATDGLVTRSASFDVNVRVRDF